MMRRSPLRRVGKKGARAIVEGRHRSPIPAVNRDRRDETYRRNFGGPAPGDYRLRIVLMPCAACKRRGPSEPAHVRARGMGGAKGSWKDLVPLCGARYGEQGCHSLYDRHRDAFRERFPGLDLATIAARLVADYLAELGLPLDATEVQP